MATRLYVALIATVTILIVFLSNVSLLFPFEPVGEYWVSRPGVTVTVNATTPKTITCNYDLAELTIYSVGSYLFNFDMATLTTPNRTNGDPLIPSGNFFTTGIRYKKGNVGRVLSESGTATLRLFWTILGR